MREKLSALERSMTCLNEVRPRRPEQSAEADIKQALKVFVSMKSGLEGRNNQLRQRSRWTRTRRVSMKSGLEGRNNVETKEFLELRDELSQ